MNLWYRIASVTFSVVDADHLSTLWAPVFLSLGCKERVDSGFLQLVQVFNHTHPISCTIPPVKCFKPLAGEVFAFITELHPSITELRAIAFYINTLLVPDPAATAMGDPSSLPGYTFSISEVSAADSTIHPAGSDEIPILDHQIPNLYFLGTAIIDTLDTNRISIDSTHR